jgi:hypothetical protein
MVAAETFHATPAPTFDTFPRLYSDAFLGQRQLISRTKLGSA